MQGSHTAFGFVFIRDSGLLIQLSLCKQLTCKETTPSENSRGRPRMDRTSPAGSQCSLRGQARQAPLPTGVSPVGSRGSNTRKNFKFQSSLEPSGGFGKGPEKSSDVTCSKQIQQRHLPTVPHVWVRGTREWGEPLPPLGTAAGGRGGGTRSPHFLNKTLTSSAFPIYTSSHETGMKALVISGL